MVLTTGNKSEMSVGYATLYGDMCGGYSALKDVYKTRCSRSRAGATALPADARGPAGRVIPERVITKPPSAELRPDQTDQDSLPPYDELDAILHGLVEQDCRRASWSRKVTTRPSCNGSRTCSTSPNTSAARPRPESRSPTRPSAATAATRSPTPSARSASAAQEPQAERRPGGRPRRTQGSATGCP